MNVQCAIVDCSSAKVLLACCHCDGAQEAVRDVALSRG